MQKLTEMKVDVCIILTNTVTATRMYEIGIHTQVVVY